MLPILKVPIAHIVVIGFQVRQCHVMNPHIRGDGIKTEITHQFRRIRRLLFTRQNGLSPHDRVQVQARKSRCVCFRAEGIECRARRRNGTVARQQLS